MDFARSDSLFVILDDLALCAQATGLPVSRISEFAEFARTRDRSLIDVLVEHSDQDESVVLARLAAKMSLRFLAEPEVESNASETIPAAAAIAHRVMPIREVGTRLEVACSDPFDSERFEELEHLLGRPVDRVICCRDVIDELIRQHYGIGADTVEQLVDNTGDTLEDVTAPSGNSSEEDSANEPTVVNLVNKVLTEAVRVQATDVHLEPYADRLRVRFRVDGVLEDVAMPASLHQLRLAIVSRIKIMANLDITEKRLPQDGRCQVSLGGQDFDLRVGILPGIHGEGIVVRLQNRQAAHLALDALGFGESHAQLIQELVARPHGLVLVTGPTGSGKTTTLYTCLDKINRPGTKVITIEDPIEYRMEGVFQMQVHEEIGYTFSRALRGMLRHDPDMLLVGEIRDGETADIAVRSALTGHLVLATLHTNDAASGVTRLLDLGVEPFLLASSVVGIVAQRLVRKLCPECKEPSGTGGMTDESAQAGDSLFKSWSSKRCKSCRFSGYMGRTVVAEVMMVDGAIRELVQQRASADAILSKARKAGMRTLAECARDKVRRGITDRAEACRVTSGDL